MDYNTPSIQALPDAQTAAAWVDTIEAKRRYLVTGTIASGRMVDAYYLDGALYADRCVCGQPTAPGLVWCGPCAAAVERLHAFATSRTCLSCGDACAAVLCDACAESGEV